jgi:hypothetical protein
MLSFMLRLLAAPLVLAYALLPAQEPQTQAARRLSLVIVAGQGVTNNIKLRTTPKTIVQVEDENHKPVAGAVVVFLLPGTGPGGTFVTGSRSAIVVADSSGRSVMPHMQLNTTVGKYEIKVHAAAAGVEGSANITQTSVSPPAISSGMIVAFIGGLAAAGVAAGVVATGAKGSSSTPAAPPVPSGTITAGSPVTIGPPH